MSTQLSLFPELVDKLVTSSLDDISLDYINNLPIESWLNEDQIALFKKDIAMAYKDGASKVLGDIIDLLYKYIKTYEA